ncbi:VOC family protein [Sinomonas halotolerans]|uniref:VOC family protein n=1 Tax=Sinomonas halotolerans TaxID=1644133 RepID=A0ABU9X4Q5_9MICC
MPSITPCLWFDTQALEAAEFYTAVFPRSEILSVSHYGEGAQRPADMVLSVEFTLDGKPFVALNGGPEFTFSEAVSMQIHCADQAEVDHYWESLTAQGGEESMCGWLKDRYGFSWQVIPRRLAELLADPDPARARRAMGAMLSMRRILIAELEAAADGVG